MLNHFDLVAHLNRLDAKEDKKYACKHIIKRQVVGPQSKLIYLMHYLA